MRQELSPLYKAENFQWFFKKRLQMLATNFRFGSWDFGRNSLILFCGTVTFSLKKYAHKIKPITLDKSRKTMSDSPLKEKEVKDVEGIDRSFSVASWTMFAAIVSSDSLLQASSRSPTVNDINVANKLLRFAKEVVQGYSMTLRCDGPSLSELHFGVYMDASWRIRPDGASQGVGTEAEMCDGKPFTLTLVSWHSKKLTRMCRSSLPAEEPSTRPNGQRSMLQLWFVPHCRYSS